MNKQRGQAMVEMLVVVVMVWLLIAAVMWLQRWQQIKLQTQHHAALSAFRFSQGWELGANQPVWQPTYHEGLLSPIAHEWHANAQPLGVMSILPSFMQQAQREGLFAQSQRWRFSTVVSDSGWLPAAWAQKKPYFLSELKLSSQTSIWVGAGHALSDEDMVQRIEKVILYGDSSALATFSKRVGYTFTSSGSPLGACITSSRLVTSLAA